MSGSRPAISLCIYAAKKANRRLSAYQQTLVWQIQQQPIAWHELFLRVTWWVAVCYTLMGVTVYPELHISLRNLSTTEVSITLSSQYLLFFRCLYCIGAAVVISLLFFLPLILLLVWIFLLLAILVHASTVRNLKCHELDVWNRYCCSSFQLWLDEDWLNQVVTPGEWVCIKCPVVYVVVW